MRSEVAAAAEVEEAEGENEEYSLKCRDEPENDAVHEGDADCGEALPLESG